MADAQTEGQPEVEGGLGGAPLETLGVRDARMIERVLRARVPISDETRQRAGELVGKLIEKLSGDDDPGYRESNSTLRSLAHLDRLNMEARKEGLDMILQERKIQADKEIAETPQEVHHTLVMVEDGDWYGNRERIDSPAADGPHHPGPNGSGQSQNGGVRPEVGENGNGAPGGP